MSVTVAPGAEGLGEMLAGLLRANLDAHPERASLLDGLRGRVNVHATDAGVGAGIVFAAGGVLIGPPHPKPELAVSCDSETLMALTSVPLRLGLPDAASAGGRAIIRKMLRRELRVRGMLSHLVLLSRLNRLLSVA